MAINTNILYKVTVYLNSAYGKNEGKKEDDRGKNIEVSGAEESTKMALTMAYAPQLPTDVQLGYIS